MAEELGCWFLVLTGAMMLVFAVGVVIGALVF
jgi:hypothetical protein